MSEAMKHTKGRLCICGNIEPLAFARCDENEALELCMAKLESFGGNNRFVLGTGGFIAEGMPIENTRAMMHAANSLYEIQT